MHITELERQIKNLPNYANKDITAIKRVAALAAICKFGPRQPILQAQTGYDPAFLDERINWLRSNNQLLTGVLDRAYLKPYFGAEGISLLEAYLQAEPAKTVSLPLAPTLFQMSLEEIQALCRARNINSNRYSQLTEEERQIYNRKGQLLKLARASGQEITVGRPPAPSPPAPKTEPKPSSKRKMICEAIAYLGGSRNGAGFNKHDIADCILKQYGQEGTLMMASVENELSRQAYLGNLRLLKPGTSHSPARYAPRLDTNATTEEPSEAPGETPNESPPPPGETPNESPPPPEEPSAAWFKFPMSIEREPAPVTPPNSRLDAILRIFDAAQQRQQMIFCVRRSLDMLRQYKAESLDDLLQRLQAEVKSLELARQILAEEES